MGTLTDIDAILQESDAQIAAASALHDEAFKSQPLRDAFRAKVKTIIEQQRSALDYLAVGITEKHGIPKGMLYYPLAQVDGEFASRMESKMPGVATAVPAIADVIRKYQPYQTAHGWIRELNTLAREQKHNRLTLQLVRSTYVCRVVEDDTGAYVEWEGLSLQPGMINSQGGTMYFRPNPDRDPSAPKLFELGAPTGYLVFGVPLDTATQRPMLSARLTVTFGPKDRWFFIDPHVPVLLSMNGYQDSVRRAVDEIGRVAGL